MSRPALASLTPEAREVRRAAARQYYLRNQEKKVAYARERRVTHPLSPEVKRAYSAKSRARHPERSKAATQRWRDNNQERYRAASLMRSKAWQKAHPEERRAYDVQYRAKNPGAKQAWLARNPGKNTLYMIRYRARKLAATVEPFTLEDWAATCELYDHRCAYCLRRAKLTQDHIEPLSRGGAHSLDNVVPACHTCNVRKNAQTLLAFLLRGA